ncbi:MAG TPA: hypothetical protein VHC22_23195 [Pirellulales bacterium]|nr:hypothetical protein [Pirellulales bacterium]
MRTSQTLLLFVGLILFLPTVPLTSAQPLLREGTPDANEPAEPDAEPSAPDIEELRRRASGRQQAELEEERQLQVQQELMRMQGERLLEEQLEIRRRTVMMRYALAIAITVIAVTLLIAYTRSRTSAHDPTPPTTAA